jgi:dienelactone hydrolase
MKKHILIFALMPVVLFGRSQNYPVGTQTVTYTDTSRSNRSISIDVHYPAVSAGASAAFANDSFPFVIIGHGFVMTPAAYYPFADTLAQRGYIVVMPNTETGFSPSHPDFAKDFIYLYRKLISESNNPSSPFYHKVIGKGAIGGHSMGGGATVLSAQYSNPAECYFTFAEATTNPSSITAAAFMTKPYLSLSGSYDCIAPYTTNQLPTYDSSTSPCKYLIEITGASHCQFGAGATTCNIGETTTGCGSPPLSRTDQINICLAYLNPYLDYYLKGQIDSKRVLDSTYRTEPVTAKKSNCVAITPGIKDVAEINVSLHPNPANDMLFINADKQINELHIMDYTGKVVMKANVNGENAQINISALHTGIYLAEISTREGQISMVKFSKQ